MTPVVFGKRKVAAGIIALFLGEVPNTLPIFGGTITIGGVLLYSCGEEAMKNKIEVVI